LSFGQFNDFIGRTFGSPFGVGTLQFRPAAASNVITAGQSFVNQNPAPLRSERRPLASGLPTVDWVGFRSTTAGSGGSVTYLAAALNTTAGEPIHSGSLAPVPEPTSLALLGLSALAAGARGIKRLREKRA
jgi:hypothetical protein